MSAVPKLRFSEFDGDWTANNLSAFVKVRGGYAFKSSDFTDVGIPVVRISNLIAETGFVDVSSAVKHHEIKNDKNYIIQKGDILIALSGATTGKSCVYEEDFASYLNQRVGKFELISNNADYSFLRKIVFSDKFKGQLDSVLVAGAQPNIAPKDIEKFSFAFPSLPEQQKIASFLSAIDKKIDLLRQKKDALELYKKGLMQKIFAQEIRFKQDDGSDFPDWEEVALGDIGSLFGGLASKSSQDFGSGKRFITYKQVFDRAEIDLSACAFVEISAGEKQNTVQAGDVIFTTSSETRFEVGFAAVVPDHSGEIYLNSFCFGYRQVAPPKILPAFARFLFRSEGYRRSVVLLAQGSTRFNISRTGFLKIRLKIPTEQEQAKIASLLLSLSKKIEAMDAAAESMETFKKGLLQQMFV